MEKKARTVEAEDKLTSLSASLLASAIQFLDLPDATRVIRSSRSFVARHTQLLGRPILALNLGNAQDIQLLLNDDAFNKTVIQPARGVAHSLRISLNQSQPLLDEEQGQHVVKNLDSLVRATSRLQHLTAQAQRYEDIPNQDVLPSTTRFWSAIVNMLLNHVDPNLETLRLLGLVDLASFENSRFSPFPADLGKQLSVKDPAGRYLTRLRVLQIEDPDCLYDLQNAAPVFAFPWKTLVNEILPPLAPTLEQFMCPVDGVVVDLLDQIASKRLAQLRVLRLKVWKTMPNGRVPIDFKTEFIEEKERQQFTQEADKFTVRLFQGLTPLLKSSPALAIFSLEFRDFEDALMHEFALCSGENKLVEPGKSLLDNDNNCLEAFNMFHHLLSSWANWFQLFYVFGAALRQTIRRINLKDNVQDPVWLLSQAAEFIKLFNNLRELDCGVRNPMAPKGRVHPETLEFWNSLPLRSLKESRTIDNYQMNITAMDEKREQIKYALFNLNELSANNLELWANKLVVLELKESVMPSEFKTQLPHLRELVLEGIETGVDMETMVKTFVGHCPVLESLHMEAKITGQTGAIFETIGESMTSLRRLHMEIVEASSRNLVWLNLSKLNPLKQLTSLTIVENPIQERFELDEYGLDYHIRHRKGDLASYLLANPQLETLTIRMTKNGLDLTLFDPNDLVATEPNQQPLALRSLAIRTDGQTRARPVVPTTVDKWLQVCPRLELLNMADCPEREIFEWPKMWERGYGPCSLEKEHETRQRWPNTLVKTLANLPIYIPPWYDIKQLHNSMPWKDGNKQWSIPDWMFERHEFKGHMLLPVDRLLHLIAAKWKNAIGPVEDAPEIDRVDLGRGISIVVLRDHLLYGFHASVWLARDLKHFELVSWKHQLDCSHDIKILQGVYGDNINLVGCERWTHPTIVDLWRKLHKHDDQLMNGLLVALLRVLQPKVSPSVWFHWLMREDDDSTSTRLTHFRQLMQMVQYMDSPDTPQLDHPSEQVSSQTMDTKLSTQASPSQPIDPTVHASAQQLLRALESNKALAGPGFDYRPPTAHSKGILYLSSHENIGHLVGSMRQLLAYVDKLNLVDIVPV